MRPLIRSWFCPNDCDRPELKGSGINWNGAIVLEVRRNPLAEEWMPVVATEGGRKLVVLSVPHDSVDNGNPTWEWKHEMPGDVVDAIQRAVEAEAALMELSRGQPQGA
jgi:hypothetical protein